MTRKVISFPIRGFELSVYGSDQNVPILSAEIQHV